MQIAHMWTRHPLGIAYAVGAALAMFALATVLGVGQSSGRVGLGLAAGAIAAMASTEYRVLALTTSGLILFRSSKTRQKATSVIDRLAASTKIEPVSGNLVITDWSVGDQVYSVMKRHQMAMVAISQR